MLSSSAGCGYFKLFVFRVLNLHKKFKYELGKPLKKGFLFDILIDFGHSLINLKKKRSLNLK